jgi:hypothetical protein
MEYTAYYGIRTGGEVPVAHTGGTMAEAAEVFAGWRARWETRAIADGRDVTLLTAEPVRIVNETMRVAAERDAEAYAQTAV